MRNVLTVWVALVVLVAVGCGGDKQKEKPSVASDPVVDVAQDDAQMNKAIADARASIDVLLAELAAPKPGYTYSVKKAFVEGEATEHMWLINATYSGTTFTGILNNRPRDLENVTEGKEYSVERSEISDWLYVSDDGKMHGGYTIRVLLPTMRDDERKQLEAMLAPLP